MARTRLFLRLPPVDDGDPHLVAPSYRQAGEQLRSLPFPWRCLSIQAVHWTPRRQEARPHRAPWLPFQWSCHTLREQGFISHATFLHLNDTEPRPAFADTLLRAMGPSGPIFSHSPAFDTQCLAELAHLQPALGADWQDVADRLVALPHLLPAHAALAARGMQPGEPASMGLSAYRRLLNPRTPPDERHALRLQFGLERQRETWAMMQAIREVAAAARFRHFQPVRLLDPALVAQVPPSLTGIFSAFQTLLAGDRELKSRPRFPGSISWLQRNLRSGYGATCALVAWLEAEGLVSRYPDMDPGPQQAGAGPRGAP